MDTIGDFKMKKCGKKLSEYIECIQDEKADLERNGSVLAVNQAAQMVIEKLTSESLMLLQTKLQAASVHAEYFKSQADDKRKILISLGNLLCLKTIALGDLGDNQNSGVQLLKKINRGLHQYWLIHCFASHKRKTVMLIPIALMKW